MYLKLKSSTKVYPIEREREGEREEIGKKGEGEKDETVQTT